MWAVRLPRALIARVRAAARSGGAGETGLSQLLWLHGVQSAGDALVAVSLAGTLFFSVPVGEARGRVALYLLVTMAPFAVVAPVVGPTLDRLRGGRRLALAGTLLGRAALAWIMAVSFGSIELYPAAFGVLVLSKAFGVARSAVVPRLLPARVTLVSANARLNLASLTLASIAAPLGVGLIHLADYSWSLRLAATVFAAAAVAALLLPPRVDVRETAPFPGGHRPRARTDGSAHRGPTAWLLGRRRSRSDLTNVLRAASALRALAGFLTLFLAFLLRTEGGGNVGIGLLAVAAAAGSFLGTAAGARLPPRAPELLLSLMLTVATLACGLGAWLFTQTNALIVALVGGFAASLGKLALDAVIQRETTDAVRGSAFARSETTLQLAWVLGGFVGIALPLDGTLGFGLCAGGLAAVLVLTVRGHRRARAVAALGATGARPSTAR